MKLSAHQTKMVEKMKNGMVLIENKGGLYFVCYAELQRTGSYAVTPATFNVLQRSGLLQETQSPSYYKRMWVLK